MKLDNLNQTAIHSDILKSLQPFPIDLQKIYPRSFCSVNALTYGLIRTSKGKKFVVMGENGCVVADPFKGECYRHASTLMVCDLSVENTDIVEKENSESLERRRVK